VCDEGRGVGPGGLGVYLDFADAIARLGQGVVAEKYGNLFEMYERITGEDPYKVPMRIYPRRTTRWAGSGSTTTS
jgi:succinate dehydrogenase / fumarate reductase flavoprotein subunit